MRYFVCFLSFFCLASTHPHDDDVQAELDHESHLFFHILDDHHYVKHLRPAASHNESVDVFAELHVASISPQVETDDIIISLDMKMSWHDARLRWNTSEYGGVTILVVPNDAIWKPRIESLSEFTTINPLQSSSSAVLLPTGDISWQTSISVRASCIHDVTQFPMTEQTCDVILPFGHHQAQKDEGVVFHFLNSDNTDIPISKTFHVNPSKSWSVEEMSLSWATFSPDESPPKLSSHEISDDVQFKFRMTKNQGNLGMTVTGPAVIIACLLPVVFMMPADSSSKVTLVVFYVINMVLCAASILTSIIVCSMANVSHHRQMPSWLKTLCFGSCGMYRWVCAGDVTATLDTPIHPPFSTRGRNMDSDPDHASLKDSDGDHIKENIREPQVMTSAPLHPMEISHRKRGHEWQAAAKVLDRLFLFLFIFALIFTSIGLLS